MISSQLHLEHGDFTFYDLKTNIIFFLLELSIGLAQNVKVMEGNNATLCVNFSSEFATNFRINVEHLLTDLMRKSIHMRISIEWNTAECLYKMSTTLKQWNLYTPTL